MARGVRKSITIPGLLVPTVQLRCAEFGHTIFTPYAVELVCYDLRSDANHTIDLVSCAKVCSSSLWSASAIFKASPLAADTT
jgi:hypothetical protein